MNKAVARRRRPASKHTLQRRLNLIERLEDRRLLAAQPTAIDPSLWQLMPRGSEALYGPLTQSTHAATLTDSGNFQFDQVGRVGVTITSSSVNALLEELESIDFAITGAIPESNIVEGFIDARHLNQLGNLNEVGLMGVRPIIKPFTNVGAAENQADFVAEADRTRNQLAGTGIDGTGVRIGVVSDSYNDLGGANGNIATGDLPGAGNPLGNTTAVTVLDAGVGGGTDEGRAMMQLIHDIAPGAQLGFSSGFGGEIAMANNIRDLARNANFQSDIIVDDIGYFSAPFYQDGVISQAITDVSTVDDVTYFTAAGNAGDSAYEDTAPTFVPDSAGLLPGNWLDFDPGPGVDTRQSVTIPAGAVTRFTLQWDDPFYTANGVDTDLDIYFVLQNSATLAAGAEADNITSQSPFEFFGIQNTGPDITVDLMIRNFAGPAPSRLKYINIDDIPVLEFANSSPAIFGHSQSADALSIAAVPYFDQDTPEDFTSIGPGTILYNPDGTPVGSTVVRNKPDVSSYDGVNTTFFGFDIEGDGAPNFFGTSAAAPNAAAIAALVAQANPGFNHTQIGAALTTTATDIGAAGWEPDSGVGVINAYDAVVGPVSPAALPFSDSFETGFLNSNWGTEFTNGGRAEITDAVPAATGTQSLLLHSNVTAAVAQGDAELSEAILNLDLAGYADVELSFAVRDGGDEDHPMPATFTGRSNSDGVAFSVDGENWHRVVSLVEPLPEVFTTQTYDLSALATSLGLTLNSNTQIKFQQFDEAPFTIDGILFDDIEVTGVLIPGPSLTGFNINGAGNSNRSGVATLELLFDSAVTLSSVNALRIYNHTTSQFLDLAGASISNNDTNAVTVNLSGVSFPDGRYTAEVLRDEVTNSTSVKLGKTSVIEFVKRAGDMNGDGVVNFADYGVIGTNFDPIVRETFRAGDANGDGAVNFADYGVVGSNFNPIGFATLPLDFGDASETDTEFATTLANDGARSVTGVGPVLGSTIDAEPDGQPSTNADGDGADEDGATFANLVRGSNVGVDINAIVSGTAYVNIWLDINRNGNWNDPGEHIIVDSAVGSGVTNLSFELPGTASLGSTTARVRINSSMGYRHTGLSMDGEVEDYALQISESQNSGSPNGSDSPGYDYPDFPVDEFFADFQDEL